jgi:hypothetical protein
VQKINGYNKLYKDGIYLKFILLPLTTMFFKKPYSYHNLYFMIIYQIIHFIVPLWLACLSATFRFMLGLRTIKYR